MEPAEASINRKVDKENLVYIHNGMQDKNYHIKPWMYAIGRTMDTTEENHIMRIKSIAG